MYQFRLQICRFPQFSAGFESLTPNTRESCRKRASQTESPWSLTVSTNISSSSVAPSFDNVDVPSVEHRSLVTHTFQ